jgi:hypothetical protein
VSFSVYLLNCVRYGGKAFYDLAKDASFEVIKVLVVLFLIIAV